MKRFIIFFFILIIAGFCFGIEFDRSKYIGIDEVEAGMDAYVLTVYKGTKIEKFDMEVLSVVKNYEPGRDAILVMGEDPRFIHTGPVAGCSGSPVYIDGRIAGALAFGWSYSKDPLYGVTPIEEMLRVGEGQKPDTFRPAFSFDFSKPLDIDRIIEKMRSPKQKNFSELQMARPLLCPLTCYGMDRQTLDFFRDFYEPLGLYPVAGASAGDAENEEMKDVKIEPGAALALPLVKGDIDLSAIGTVTEVTGDQVFAFGHSFQGAGKVDIPIATGKIHTVVSTLVRSFKFGTPGKIVGALRADESTAIRGVLGAKPEMIPLNITIDRFNDPETRNYECSVASHQRLTPLLVASATSGAANMKGKLPEDNLVRYKGKIEIEGFQPVQFSNTSTLVGTRDFLKAVMTSTSMILSNPWHEAKIKSFDLYAELENKNILSQIWSVNVSDDEVEPGDTVKIDIVLEGYNTEKKKYTVEIQIPDDLKPGNYKLSIMGGKDYESFLRRNATYRFMPINMDSLIDSMNNLLNVKMDRLYVIFAVPSKGLVIERSELPDLPSTRAMVLLDNKRTVEASPYKNWIQKEIDTQMITVNENTVSIKVN